MRGGHQKGHSDAMGRALLEAASDMKSGVSMGPMEMEDEEGHEVSCPKCGYRFDPSGEESEEGEVEPSLGNGE